MATIVYPRSFVAIRAGKIAFWAVDHKKRLIGRPIDRELSRIIAHYSEDVPTTGLAAA